MSGLDWIIIALVVLLAVYGYAQGFVVGALTLAGFAAGAFVGSRLGPALLSEGSSSPYAPLFALGGAVLGGALLAVGLEAFGLRVRGSLTLPGLGVVDGLLGALLSGAVGLALAWVVGAVVLQAPAAAGLRNDVQRSAILSAVNGVLSPRGVLNALARFDPLPTVPGPRVEVEDPPPRAAIADDPDIERAAASVVRVTGTACGLGVAGSGWVAGDDLVVTNAHVVAGQEDTKVQIGGDGPSLDTTPVAFDATNDIAVLRVPGLDAPALELADEPDAGTPGAVLGFPLNGPYDVRPARLGGTFSARSQDAYGRGPVQRAITGFRGRVRSGNSGGPVLNRAGRVATTVFAATVGRGKGSGYGVPNRIVRERLAGVGEAVDTGPCTA